MLIQPNSTINILKNVPLDNTYNHTLWFDNVAAQTTYFASTTKYTFPVQTYQRVNRGVMRLNRKADDIYDCNYLMFQNTSYGNKWFYAFITAIEYVNDVTCEITFSIDPMQTYLFDIELKMCFVEREHSSTDNAGDNIVDEPVNTGDMVIADITDLYVPTSYCGVIAQAGEITGQPVGGKKSGLFTGVEYNAYDIDTPADVTAFAQALFNISDRNMQDGVVSVFMMPTVFVDGTKLPPGSHDAELTKQKPKPTTLDGYTPRNKKLLTFPYNYLILDTYKDSGVYRYEWFHGPYMNWEIEGICVPNAQLMAVPRGYGALGKQGGIQYNYAESLVLEGFPQIAYTVDSYRAYLAQSAVGATVRGIENAFDANVDAPSAPLTTTIGADIGTGNFSKLGSDISKPIKALFEDLLGLKSGETGSATWNKFKRGVESSKHPNKASGSPSGEILVASRYHGFWMKQMCVSQNYARIIDDFFDMYGYATMRVKIPNRTVRPHWNYVKTNGCDVVGNAPADDIRAVCKIYDSGITFWKNPSEVGNYSLNNSL